MGDLASNPMTSAGFTKWPRDHVWFHSAPDPFLIESGGRGGKRQYVYLKRMTWICFFLSEKIRDQPKS